MKKSTRRTTSSPRTPLPPRLRESSFWAARALCAQFAPSLAVNAITLRPMASPCALPPLISLG